MSHEESPSSEIYYYICSPNMSVFTYLSKTILCADSVHLHIGVILTPLFPLRKLLGTAAFT